MLCRTSIRECGQLAKKGLLNNLETQINPFHFVKRPTTVAGEMMI